MAAAPRPKRTPTLTPFLWFDDDLEEAAAFYAKVFPGSKTGNVVRYGDAGPGPKGKVMSMDFEIAGHRFAGVNGGPVFQFNESVSFQVDCQDQAEVDYYWDALTADGGVESQCGWLKDKFGLSWQVVPRSLTAALSDKDPKRASRAMQAMLTMRKIDIATIQAAADGKKPELVTAGARESQRVRADTEAAVATSRKKR
jgi:predicted 3-demethylubiquinone-9 3-methyltransferase (glyoxalase superfamily)